MQETDAPKTEHQSPSNAEGLPPPDPEKPQAQKPERPPAPKPERPPAPKINHDLPSVQAHLDQLQPVKPEKIRWLYREDKKWVPFSGSDSLNIERVYRKQNGIAGCNDSMGFEEFSDVSDWKEYCPTVRGQVYEVNVEKRNCYPIYWKDDPVRILRGTWFKTAASYDYWEPLEEENAIKIEETHISILRSLGVGSFAEVNNDSPILHRMEIWPGYCVEWHDITDIRLVNKSTSSKLVQKIGLSGPTSLSRGFHTDCDKNDAPSEIVGMVFVIHGIGQMFFSSGGVHNNCKRLRETAEKAVKKFFVSESKAGRIEFFPVEWRTGLKLDDGILESITPDCVEGIRKLLNESTMDVMYYTSPSFRVEITRTLREQVNLIYEEFCARNPSFAEKGQVSFIAHSLGSVILYDVLTTWNAALLKHDAQQADPNVAYGNASLRWPTPFYTSQPSENDDEYEPMEVVGNETETLRKQLLAAHTKLLELEAKLKSAQIEQSSGEWSTDDISLKFKTYNTFNIGSPLGVFLIMRGIRPRDDIQQHILPSSVCGNMYNIYEPSDPVAYRIEPLIYKHYKEVSPIRISNITKHFLQHGKDSSGKLGMAAASSGWIRGWFSHNKSEDPVEYQSKEVVLPRTEEEKDEELLRNKAVLDHRIDFVLEAGYVELLSLITSHMSYWSNTDLLKFILNRIYSQIESS